MKEIASKPICSPLLQGVAVPDEQPDDAPEYEMAMFCVVIVGHEPPPPLPASAVVTDIVFENVCHWFTIVTVGGHLVFDRFRKPKSVPQSEADLALADADRQR